MRLLPLALLPLALSVSAVQADDTEQRIQFIENHFEQTREHSELWQWGWFGFLGSATVAQGIGANVVDDDKMQYDFTVGATTSFLGAADMLLNPMKNHNYYDQLAAMPANSPAEKKAKLDQAESYLAAAVKRESYEQSWVNHTLAGLVNGLAGLAVAYDDKRPIDGWVTFATGMIVTEIKIYTAPQSMISANEAYQQGNYQAQAAKVEPQRWHFAAAGPQLFASYRF